MASDNYGATTYSALMDRGVPFIRLKLDTDQPIELSEFVGAFTSLAAEYDRYVRREHPDAPHEAAVFVKEVRSGCIEADLVPLLLKAGAGTLAFLAAANTVYDFVKNYGGRMGVYKEPGGRADGATKTELKDFSEQVAAIASAPGSALSVAAIEIEDGEHKVRAAFRFTSDEAREIQQRVEEHKRELDHVSRADRERVLMVFTRSDVGNAPIGKRSGERVKIEAISPKPRALIYASELAEQHIKHEIAEAEDNVYKKGFVVDVNVEFQGGKPIAYSVTHVHQVIDLDDN